MKSRTCFHCGLPCQEVIQKDGHSFCCAGCLAVYELLVENQLQDYYKIAPHPGSPSQNEDFSYLDQERFLRQFALYVSQTQVTLSLEIPSIHCASCVYLLENLHTLFPGILHSEVHFPQKKLILTFHPQKTSFSQICHHLAQIGYPPRLSLGQKNSKESTSPASSLIPLGVAAFCLGNIMLFSFPEYLSGDQVPPHFRTFFRYACLFLSLPILFYCAMPWIKRAIGALQCRKITFDIPITLGIFTLFAKSSIDVLRGAGQGYFDSLAGFVFLLLLAQYFQNQYFFHSLFQGVEKYIPLGISKEVSPQRVQKVPVDTLKTGDVIHLRHGELVPVDSLLLSPQALLDYSSLTGESEPVSKKQGEEVLAGGIVAGKKIRLQVLRPLHESFFTALWKRTPKKKPVFSQFLQTLSPYFTGAVLLLATTSLFFWGLYGAWGKGALAFVSILMVTCPCGIALSAPFTQGYFLRLLAKEGIFIQSGSVLESLGKIKQIVFDKTGTLTKREVELSPLWEKLSTEQKKAFATLAAQSFHPVSQALFQRLSSSPETKNLEKFREISGKGLEGVWKGIPLRLGKLEWLRKEKVSPSRLGLLWEGEILAVYEVKTAFRPGLSQVLKKLSQHFSLYLLTGDGEKDKKELEKLFPKGTPLRFRCSPEEKKQWVLKWKQKGPLAMVGDGINDASALEASDVAIAVMDQAAHFLPQADCVIESRCFSNLPKLFQITTSAKHIVLASLSLSLAYNTFGIYYAFLGKISPLFLGILMPLSSFSVLCFTGVASYLVYYRLFRSDRDGSAVPSHWRQSLPSPSVSSALYSRRSEWPV